MKCIIPGQNVKVLGRAIHSLAKLGDELYVESSTSDLSFRTVNMSKTAYASFSFGANFFSYFCDDKNGLVRCQISMKSSLAVFRSPMTLEKTVESCQIKIQPDSDKLVFIMKYKRGVLKTYRVRIIDCEILQAYYHKNKAVNKFSIQSKTAGEILSNFKLNQDEITWLIDKNGVTMRNFAEDEDGPTGVRTEIRVEKDEFDEFKVQSDSEVTFCLKELRAILLFSESVCLPLSANFRGPGKPIVFIIMSETFEANMVVSTLTGSDGCTPTISQAKTTQKVGVTAEDRQPEEADTTMEVPFRSVGNIVQESMPNGSERNASPELVPSANARVNIQKLRQTFNGCFPKKPFTVNDLPGFEQVLASDSGSE